MVYREIVPEKNSIYSIMYLVSLGPKEDSDMGSEQADKNKLKGFWAWVVFVKIDPVSVKWMLIFSDV